MARQTQNPVADLISLPFQNNTNFKFGPQEKTQNVLNVQPVIPFHLNDNWKPLVHPPVTDKKKKVSVFATRSPHRPNSIGMSCVELIKVDGLDVYIRNFDMLNNSPVLDIKPYIPGADSFPDAKIGWLENVKLNSYRINFSLIPMFHS